MNYHLLVFNLYTTRIQKRMCIPAYVPGLHLVLLWEADKV